MKRSSTSIPELPVAARRKRALTAEEHALWESVAKQIKPLRKQPRTARAEAISAPAEAPAKPAASPRPLAAALRAPKPAPPPLAPRRPRERSQLSRGRKDNDARLDRHGMTQSPPHRPTST